MALRDYDDAKLASLHYELIKFQGGNLDNALKDYVQTDITRCMNDLRSKTTPLDNVRYAQGELAQAYRDIMIVDRLLKAVEREIADRKKD